MIRHIRRGHQGTTLAPKYKGKYGKASNNNIGVFQGAAISPILFIIYLDDMMEDLEALNRRTNLPIRMIQDRPHQQQEELLLEEIRKKSTKYEEHIAICDIREEDEKANHIRMGKPTRKLTGWAKKWTAQFKNKHKSDSTTSTKTKQKQQKEYEKEKDTTGNDEIRTEGVGDDTEEVEETDTQRKKQANKVLWRKKTQQSLRLERNTEGRTRTKKCRRYGRKTQIMKKRTIAKTTTE